MNILKSFTILSAALLFVACGSAQSKSSETVVDSVAQSPKVYMTTDISPEGLVKVYEALGVDYDGKVAVKISTG